MDKKVAFIGTGYMGGVIIRAACKALDPQQIIVTDFLPAKAEELAAELGCRTAKNNEEAVRAADCVMLCVKPQVINGVLAEIAPVLTAGFDSGAPKTLCSIAAGIKISAIRQRLDRARYPVVRMMPNAPAFVGKGLMLLGCDDAVSQEEINDLKHLVSHCGAAEMLDERLFDQATATASCSPAFVYMLIEALADGGVAIGLSRADAQAFAAQAVYGAAAMVLETGMHPGALKDMVCSPGGSTIAGVSSLEENGFRGALIDAVVASYQRNTELGGQ